MCSRAPEQQSCAFALVSNLEQRNPTSAVVLYCIRVRGGNTGLAQQPHRVSLQRESSFTEVEVI